MRFSHIQLDTSVQNQEQIPFSEGRLALELEVCSYNKSIVCTNSHSDTKTAGVLLPVYENNKDKIQSFVNQISSFVHLLPQTSQAYNTDFIVFMLQVKIYKILYNLQVYIIINITNMP